MRHRVFGRKLGRSKHERASLFRNLVSELILYGRVKTTVAKAKSVKPFIDKLVTKAKKESLRTKREIFSSLPKKEALSLIDIIAPQFKGRTSGFSRIVHLGGQRGDSAQLVLLEWAEEIRMSKVGSQPPSPTQAKEKLEAKSIDKKTVTTKDKPVKAVVARKRLA